MYEIILTVILSLIGDFRAHPLIRKPDERKNVIQNIIFYSKKYEIDPIIGTYTAFRESSFLPNLIGHLGEIGRMQTHGIKSSVCKKENLYPGSLGCGIYLLKKSLDKCQTLHGMLCDYQTKYGCKCSNRYVESRIEWFTKYCKGKKDELEKNDKMDLCNYLVSSDSN